MIKKGLPKPHKELNNKKHPPIPPRDDLESLILHLGHLLHHRRHHHFGASQDEVLNILKKKENISQKDLGGHLKVKPGSLSELINKLEEKDLVLREKDEEDKRFSNISLTKKGKNFLKKKEDIKEKDIFKILNKEEKEILKNIINKLINSLEK